jgi:hypothetical protein
MKGKRRDKVIVTRDKDITEFIYLADEIDNDFPEYVRNFGAAFDPVRLGSSQAPRPIP